MIELACETCGKAFLKPRAWAKRNARQFCSRPCYWTWRKHDPEIRARLAGMASNGKGKSRKPVYGAENPAWKGGVTYFRKKGNYKPIKYVRCPEAFLPMARKDGYVMEHRLIMARMVGRCLLRREVVHHRDHNPQNNDPANLMLFPTNSSHKRAEGAVSRAFLVVSAQP